MPNELERYQEAEVYGSSPRPRRSGGAVPRATGKPIKVVRGAPGDAPDWARKQVNGGGQSLLGQVGGTVLNAGKGLIFDLPPVLWDSTVGNVGAAVAGTALGQDADEIRGRGGALGTLGRVLSNESAMESFARSDGPSLRPDAKQSFEKLSGAQPLVAGLGHSAVVEGRDLGQLAQSLAPGGLAPGDTEWAKAVDESRVVQKLVDTLGSATLAARLGFGTTAGVGQMAGRDMTRTQRIASAARAADDAVDRAVLAPFRLAGRAAAPPIRAARQSAPAQRLSQSGPMQWGRSRLIGPAARGVRDELTIGERAVGTRGQAEAIGPAVRVQRILTQQDRPRAERSQRPAVIVSDMDAVANLDAITRANPEMEARLGLNKLSELSEMSPEAFDAYVSEFWLPQFGGDLSSTGARMFLKYRLGTLADDMATDIGRASDEIRAARTQRGEVDIAGERVPIGQQAFLDVRGRLEPDTEPIRRFNEQSLRAEVLPQNAARVRAEAEPVLSDLRGQLARAEASRRPAPEVREWGDFVQHRGGDKQARGLSRGPNITGTDPTNAWGRYLQGIDDGLGLSEAEMRSAFGDLARLMDGDEGYQSRVADYFSERGLGPDDYVRVYRGNDGGQTGTHEFTNVTLDPEVARKYTYGEPDSYVVRAGDIRGIIGEAESEILVRTADLADRPATTGDNRTLRSADRARGRLAREEARVEQRIAEANERLDAAPAQWRPVVQMARNLMEGADTFDWSEYGIPQEWVDDFKAELSTSVSEIVSTVDPVYAPGGRSAGVLGGTGTGKRARKQTSAHQKETGNIPLHSDKQAALVLADIRQQEMNQTMLRVRERMGSAATEFDIPEGADGPTIIALASDQMGTPMVAWDPTRLFATDRTGQILVDSQGRRIRGKGDAKVAPANVTPEAVLVPEWVADSFDYAVSRQSEMAQLLIDKPTRIFKGSVLALSGRWQAGNAISGAIMMAADGVPISDVIAYSRTAWNELRAFRRGETTVLPRWLLDSNMSAQELKTLRGVAEAVENIDFDEYLISRPKNRLLRAGGDVVRAGYEANTFVDNFYKSVAYLKWVDEGVDSSAAVQRALDTLGDYDRMTPFERRVVRRVLPFWAWTRHITQLSARLATEHPARTAFNLHLATLFQPDEATMDKAPWLQGAARVGEEWLSIGWMFPFDSTASIFPDEPGEGFDPAAFAVENLNPVFGAYSSVLGGVEPSFGKIEPLFRPDADFGQTGGSPLFTRPQSVPYLVGQNLPQFRALYDELQRRRSGGEGQRLYDTGERTGKEDPNRRLEDNVARLFGVPFPKTYDT